MWKDPIVEEIHAVRRRIAEECGYDMSRIMKYLKKKEDERSGRIVRKKQLGGARRPGRIRH